MRDLVADWPEDADGGVLRRLAEHGFDFSKPWSVDFDVDFEQWPPSTNAVELLRSMYGKVTIYPPDEHGAGYAEFQVVGRVSYESVTSIQRRTTAAMQPFGGKCECWGILHGGAA